MGDWRIGGYDGKSHIILDGEGNEIAYVRGRGTPAGDANARRIASLPEMYGILELLFNPDVLKALCDIGSETLAKKAKGK